MVVVVVVVGGGGGCRRLPISISKRKYVRNLILFLMCPFPGSVYYQIQLEQHVL